MLTDNPAAPLILVIEDNSSHAGLIKRSFEDAAEKYRLECVVSLGAARTAIERQVPDLVLTDYRLPDGEGSELLVTVKGLCPVVLMTSQGNEQVAVTAMKAGAQDYVVKSASVFSEIPRIIQRNLREWILIQGQKQADESLRVHQIELELQNEELRRTQEAIAASNKLLQAIINTAPMRVFWKDKDLRYLGCNFAFARDAGVKSPDDLIGKDDFQLGWNEQTESYRADDLQVIESGIPKLSYDELQTKSDGQQIWIRTSKVPLRNESNETIGVLGVYDDITNRKQTEDALKGSEEFIRDILSSIDEAFVVIDRDYRIVSANRAFCEQTGMPLGDIIGKHCYEISRHLTRPCHEVDRNCACKRTFETGEPSIFVYKLTDKKGVQTHLEAKTYAMKDEAGNVKSVIEIINDITEKTNLEIQFRQAQKMEAVGTLAGGIAHDFNNILTAIIGFGYITLMKMGPDDPVRQNIENILEGADRAALLTKDLLIFSRKQVSEKRPIDLNEIIGKVEKFLVRVIGEDIKCSFALHNEPIVVHADPHQLEQLLMNLATNAKDAMAKSGDLIISAEQILVENDFITIHGYGKPGRYALLTISDSGEGMDEETRKKIFDPFFFFF